MRTHSRSQFDNRHKGLLVLMCGLLFGVSSCASGRQTQSPTTPVPDSSSTFNVGNAGKQATTDRLEQTIAQYLPQEINVPVQSVVCPQPTILVAGNGFDCEVKISEGTFPVRVSVRNSEGQVTLKTRQILVLSEAEARLQQSIKQRDGIEIKANCGSKVKIVKKVGETFECRLTDSAGKTGRATMTVTSKEGKVDARWTVPESGKRS